MRSRPRSRLKRSRLKQSRLRSRRFRSSYGKSKTVQKLDDLIITISKIIDDYNLLKVELEECRAKDNLPELLNDKTGKVKAEVRRLEQKIKEFEATEDT